MRIIKRQVKDQPLTVIVEYPQWDDAAEVYYLENVERKLFLYAREQVYRLDGSLTELEERLAGTEFVRISRTCIMNTAHLRELRQIKNSHLETVLDNGEKLIVSRKYLKDIKRVFGRSR